MGTMTGISVAISPESQRGASYKMLQGDLQYQFNPKQLIHHFNMQNPNNIILQQQNQQMYNNHMNTLTNNTNYDANT